MEARDHSNGANPKSYTSRRNFFILALLLFCGMTANAQLFGKKVKTINVVPDNAKIIIGGTEVGTGTYELTMGKPDYVLIKLSAPGHIDKTVKVYKSDKSNSHTFKLEIDDSYAASESSSDLANKPMRIVVRKDLTADALWKRLMSYTSDQFPNLEITDKSAGWIRSSWEIQSFAYATVRTRIEIKEIPGMDDLTYKITLQSEYAWNSCGLDDQCFRQWDRVLKRYKQSIEDLMNSVQ